MKWQYSHLDETEEVVEIIFGQFSGLIEIGSRKKNRLFISGKSFWQVNEKTWVEFR